MPQNAGLSKADAQAKVIALIGQGSKVEAAMSAVGRASRKTYENWRAEESDFGRRVDEARARFERASEGGRDTSTANLGFEEWRKRFLGRDTYPHQRMWIDVLEGREPEDLHSAVRHEVGNPLRLLINTPPYHSKALALDTILPTPHGWATIADLRVGDEVYGVDGKPARILAKSEVFDKPCFKVSINDGESFVASEDHLWTIRTTRWSTKTLTTRELFDLGPGRYNLPVHGELISDDVDLPLDPYILGAWLGDGHTADGRITTADIEMLDEFRAAGFEPAYSRPAGGLASTYQVPGLFRKLSELGVRGKKFVPEGYLFASPPQRLALLQGLMDTDGTASSEGQCSFTNTNLDLARGVLTLASSLGLRPSIRESRAMLNGVDCGPKWTVHFAANGIRIFRLGRKQTRLPATPKRGPGYRAIVAVEPIDTVPTQCISVDNDSHLFLIGRSLVPTHNSTVITTEYVVYRICMNPNIRVKIVSKTREFAQSLLYAIKQMLTSSQFSELQAAYAPIGRDGVASFKSAEGAWTAFLIYVAGKGEDAADPAAKDPTVQALGIGGQIYGTRADLIIVDDAITLDNASNHEKQIIWLRKEVGSRVKNGKIIVVGTRVASVDLYSELRNPDNFSSGKSNWTYLAQPAVLEYADDPKDWVTLWPRSTQAMDEEDPGDPDENGTYPAWDGPALEDVRSGLDEKSWALVYQQAEIAEDTVFHPKCVNGSVNGQRKPGPLIAGAFGHPTRGPEGKHVIGSIDPAGTGEAFILIYAVDRQSKHRYVLNCFMANHTTPEWYANQIELLTPQYGVKEWVIEQNAYASWLIHDRRIVDYCQARGVTVTPHYTSRNKQDPDFGVASMASLFGTVRNIQEGGREEHNGDNIIWLPDKHRHSAVQALVTQLIQWQPGKLGKQLRMDGPMALWFAELRARQIIGEGAKQQQSHMRTRFMTNRHRKNQIVLPAEYFTLYGATQDG